MSPFEAAKLLEIAPDATPEQIESRFLELQARLEDKIAKAPTPGLKVKYRETLAELTTAFETLTLAADSSALPVLRRKAPLEARGARQEAGVSESDDGGQKTESRASRPTPHASPSRRSGAKEFALVAVIAVVVLGAGGWFVLKTRAENAEKERVAAEAKAAAEQKAAAEKRAADEARQAKELADRAERERLDRLLTQVRTRVAELTVTFDALLRTEQTAERELSELRSQEREALRASPNSPETRELIARASAQETFVTWLRNTLPTHPARVAKARVDELISARAADEAVTAAEAYAQASNQLQQAIAASRRELLIVTGSLRTASTPAGLEFTVQDAWGRTHRGQTPAELTNLALGAFTVTFQRPGWPEQRRTGSVSRQGPTDVSTEFPSGSIAITSTPSGATVWSGDRQVGTTPYNLADVPPGRREFELRLAGHFPQAVGGEVVARQPLTLSATLRESLFRSGQIWTIPDLNLTLQPIEPGTFLMGSPASESGREVDEVPQTQVTLSQGFWLGKTEVTQAQWTAIMGDNPSNFKGTTLPVENVSWTEAMDFCRRLTERERQAGRLPEGYEYTLPTEAQWEYAARAGTTGLYAGSLDAMGWYAANSGSTTHPVGQKQPNAWGLQDMHGNVWEWCADWYGNYPGGSVTNPKGPTSGTLRVIRGGGWFNVASGARSALRYGFAPGVRYYDLGFRLALSSVR